MSQSAIASGDSSNHGGKGLEAKAQALAKKQIAKSGLTDPVIAAALAAYRSARESAITLFRTATKGARDALRAATSPA